MQRFLTALIILASLYSCKGRESWSYYSTPHHRGCKNSVSLSIYDTLKIRVPDRHYNFFHNVQIYQDSILYGVNLFDGLRLSVYNLKSSCFLYDILLDRNTSGTSGIENFRVVSKDSIFIVTTPKLGLILVDSHGKRIARWDDVDMHISPNKEPGLSANGFGISTNSFLENFQYEADSSSMFFVLSPVTARDEAGSPDISRHGIYNLDKRQWEKIFAPYEGVLKHKGMRRYYFDMHHPYQLVVGDKMYVTYPVDHRVYVYSMRDYEMIGEKDISPSFAVRFPRPLERREASQQKLVELRNSTPYYGPLYYHSSADCFSRFYNLKQSAGKERERALVIYDKDFNIVYEKVYPMKDISTIVPLSDGFVFIPMNNGDADTILLTHSAIYNKRV